MMKKLGLAGISLLLSWSVAGCGKVEKCTRGEPGCLGGPTDESGGCSAGLTPEGGKCVEGGGDLPGYCEDAESVPETVSVPQSCLPRMGETLSFAELCRRRCLQQCKRAEVFCEGFECQSDCGNKLEECQEDCPQADAMEAAACLTASCQAIQTRRCEAFECPSGSSRNCSDVKCSDSCTSVNTNDTFCDDGDPSSALYALCAYGTDCSDCGPRRGNRPPRSPIQGLCPGGRDVACEGYNDDYTRNGAFCVHVDGTQAGQFSCVPDCTGVNEDCEDGFECQGLVYMNGDPYEDLAGVQGHACFPTFCK